MLSVSSPKWPKGWNPPVRPDGYRGMTIGRGIRAAASRVPDRAALVLGDASISYRQLVRRIAQVATMASGYYGINAGDRVAVIAPNCIEYVELVAGLSDLGAIVATLSARLTRAELQAILDDCTPSLIIAHHDCAGSMDADWAKDVPILWLGAEYEAMLAKASDAQTDGIGNEEAAFALAYTSGTTGKPKGVLLSHRSRAITFASMAAEYRCFGPDDNFLALAPMAHGAGFVFAAAGLHFGATTSLFASQDPEEILARLGVGDISGIFMVPTHFARLNELPEAVLAKYKSHQLRTIISNAAALPQPMKEFAVAHFGDGLLHETYGSTEGGIVTNIRPPDLQRKPGSVGLPFPHMEVELRGEDGSPAETGQPGELFCRGPTLFNGYWNRPEATAETLVDGWVTVGDIAMRDADGYITIVDRKKDMVVTGGMNVYPREIENVIVELPGVREVAVVGTPDQQWGESLHAFIVASNGSPPNADAIIAGCREQLAGYKVPRAISFIAELPRNAGGKILKTTLREQVGREQVGI
jgi:acyl-CoA synthetase (AMP-forming)/AMP-acid ligase II